MEHRTVIEKFADGNLVMTRETRRHIAVGSARDRRRANRQKDRGEVAPEWRKAERKNFRDKEITEEIPFGPGVTVLPFGSPETAAIALENEELAGAYTCEAFDVTQKIAANIDAFAHDPSFCKIRKVKKVVLVNEDGTVEELNATL